MQPAPSESTLQRNAIEAMPTYEYRCPDGHHFELFQKMSDEPRAACPTCGKEAQRMLSAGAGLLFKGSGFYITDYRPESYRSEARKDEGGTSASGSEGGAARNGKEGTGKGDGGSSGSSASGSSKGSESGSGKSADAGGSSTSSSSGPAD